MKSVRLSSEQCSRVVGPLWPGAPPALETWEGYYGDQSVCLLDIKLSSPGSIWGIKPEAETSAHSVLPEAETS